MGLTGFVFALKIYYTQFSPFVIPITREVVDKAIDFHQSRGTPRDVKSLLTL